MQFAFVRTTGTCSKDIELAPPQHDNNESQIKGHTRRARCNGGHDRWSSKAKRGKHVFFPASFFLSCCCRWGGGRGGGRKTNAHFATPCRCRPNGSALVVSQAMGFALRALARRIVRLTRSIEERILVTRLVRSLRKWLKSSAAIHGTRGGRIFPHRALHF